MKNALLASTALMLTAGIAAADVTVSGSGRFGLNYQENGIDDPATAGVDESALDETSLSYRLRLNFDASVEADNGLAFGGRIRMQETNATAGAGLSAAMLYVTYEGLRVEVGNANTAYDSVALMYNPEVGFQSRSFGDPQGNFYSFSSGPTAANRVGVMVSYAVGGLNARFSYVDPDQTVADSAAAGVVGATTETGVSFDYTTGPFTFALAYVQDGAGINGNDQTFAGVAYAIDADTNVGLNYIDEGNYPGVVAGTTVDNGTTIVLYGSRNFGQISAIAYVSNNDAPNSTAVPAGIAGNKTTDTAYGIGAGYDLGGAVLSASVERGYDERVRGDVGITFNF